MSAIWPRSLEHGDQRHPATEQALRLVGVEGGCRDEVVVEALEPLRDVLQEGALGLDAVGEGLVDPRGVVRRVGAGALREQDPDRGPGAFALACGRERGRGRFIGREPGARRLAKHLGDDPAERVLAPPERRPIGDVRARPMT